MVEKIQRICPIAIRRGQICNPVCPWNGLWYDPIQKRKVRSCYYVHKVLAPEDDENCEDVRMVSPENADADVPR